MLSSRAELSLHPGIGSYHRGDRGCVYNIELRWRKPFIIGSLNDVSEATRLLRAPFLGDTYIRLYTFLWEYTLRQGLDSFSPNFTFIIIVYHSHLAAGQYLSLQQSTTYASSFSREIATLVENAPINVLISLGETDDFAPILQG